MTLLHKLAIFTERYWVPRVIERFQPEYGGVKYFPNHISPDDVYLEVGARVGNGLMFARSFCRPKLIYGVEPNKKNFAVLRGISKRFPNIRVFNWAISDFVGKGIFIERGASSTLVSSSMLDKSSYVGHVKGKRRVVKVATLDSLNLKPPPTVITLDCEGEEARVLKGASNILENVHSVMVETHLLSSGGDTADSVVEILRALFENVVIDDSGTRHEYETGKFYKERWIIASNPTLLKARMGRTGFEPATS